jgi:hypothetical protein
MEIRSQPSELEVRIPNNRLDKEKLFRSIKEHPECSIIVSDPDTNIMVDDPTIETSTEPIPPSIPKRNTVYRYRIKLSPFEWTYYNSISELANNLRLIRNTVEVHYSSHPKGKRATTMRGIVIYDIERANNKDYLIQYKPFTQALISCANFSEFKAEESFNNYIFE